ncbi:efflux RND transporter periplasmic adaptor subunit [Desulfosarcina variabilis]|uniref:efflux RND transporter periplasmic adaptor subunit n=1 Tax=Desulfosarcina variabilis TaxID=2300 RepID=UPI003AFB5CB1
MKGFEKMKKWLIFGLITTICSLGAVGLYAMKPEQKKKEKTSPPLKRVSVEPVAPGTYPARVKVYGEVHAKWTTTLRSRVGGQIIWINENLLPGRHFRTGETILSLDRTDYQAALAQARLELENARVNLAQVERQAYQARNDWEASGIKQAPASPLVFYKPQLKAAQARVDYARKAVEKAREDLNHTRITAPYDSLVAERFADKGEILFAGDHVATLISADDVEIRVSLDGTQVRSLGRWQDAEVEIGDPATGRSWRATMIRDGGQVNPKTRLRQFYLRPLDPKKELAPGMFVTAVIKGSPRANLLALPESCLTRDGEIWFVDAEDRLRRLTAEVAFYEDGNVYVKNSIHAASLRVVTTPIPGFIAGTRTAPAARKEG